MAKVRRDHTLQMRFGPEELAKLDRLVSLRSSPTGPLPSRAKVVRDLIDEEIRRVDSQSGKKTKKLHERDGLPP